ncbi:hypothetical protein D3C80_1496950 [compost metagenome]
MGFLVGLGTVFHRQEELVSERLHYQCNLGLFISQGLGQGCGKRKRREYGDSQQAPWERQLHGFTPDLMIFIGSQTFALSHYGNVTKFCQIHRRRPFGKCA